MRRCCTGTLVMLLLAGVALAILLPLVPRLLEHAALEAGSSQQVIVELGIGERYHGLRFDAVLLDERCPLGEFCADYGTVTVNLRIDGHGQRVELGRMSSVLRLSDGYTAQVIAVEPYPGASAEAFRVRLQVFVPYEGEAR